MTRTLCFAWGPKEPEGTAVRHVYSLMRARHHGTNQSGIYGMAGLAQSAASVLCSYTCQIDLEVGRGTSGQPRLGVASE
jgi:hypothetical protein